MFIYFSCKHRLIVFSWVLIIIRIDSILISLKNSFLLDIFRKIFSSHFLLNTEISNTHTVEKLNKMPLHYFLAYIEFKMSTITFSAVSVYELYIFHVYTNLNFWLPFTKKLHSLWSCICLYTIYMDSWNNTLSNGGWNFEMWRTHLLSNLYRFVPTINLAIQYLNFPVLTNFLFIT